MSRNTSILKKRNNINLRINVIKKFLNHIGNPQDNFNSVIIGGTNGKGSVTFYLSNLALNFANLKVGRYISPHLISPNERFIINEKEISKKKYFSYLNDLLPKIKEFEKAYLNNIKFTEFEIYTILAFLLFSNEKVDIAFLEVGLGGRLDATNVVSENKCLCSVITNVTFDHMDILGDSIEKIAYEKAGIIKKNKIVFTGASGVALEVIKNQALKKNAKLIKIKFTSKDSYIEKNIKLAIQTFFYLLKTLNIKSSSIKNLNQYLKSLTYNGRFQYIREKKILLDGAHNEDGALELNKLLRLRFKRKKIIYLIGMLDKDYKSFLDKFTFLNNIVFFTEPKSKRKTSSRFLYNYLSNKKNVYTCKSLYQSIIQARKYPHDLILITGSLYLVGEALKLSRKGTI